MSMESSLVAVLMSLCPNVYPDVAPVGSPRPYVTWRALGGEARRYVDNEAYDVRNVLMQINVWDISRIKATTLIRQIEDALCADTSLTAIVHGAPVSDYEEDTELYGALQRYIIWAPR